jgi:mannitol/fructose-specific phosphotransferase system IIA component (Ntr-type)
MDSEEERQHCPMNLFARLRFFVNTIAKPASDHLGSMHKAKRRVEPETKPQQYCPEQQISKAELAKKGEYARISELERMAKTQGLHCAPELLKALSEPSPPVAETARFLLKSIGWAPLSASDEVAWASNCPYEQVVIEDDGHSREILVERRSHRCTSLQNAVFEINFEADDKWHALRNMFKAMYCRSGLTRDQIEIIRTVVEKRETSMTTATGFGLAIPHASSDLSNLEIGWFRLSRGMNWDSLDNLPVYFVVCFVVPQGQFQKHLRTLGEISVLHNAELRDALDRSKTSQEFRFHIVRALYARE